MEMANCKKCKKLFPRVLSPICEECLKEEEEIFQSVRKYLQDNPHSTVADTSEATGVSVNKILGYLRDGRLELSETNNDLHCRMCGVPIKTANYCEPCFMKVRRDVNAMIAREKNEEPVRELPEPKAKEHISRRTTMHTGDRRARETRDRK